MQGLALEGGGARGAYHVGVARALFEHGYVFDGYVGTSIGAINAAAFAQGDFEKLLDMWLNITLDKVFDEHEQRLLKHIESEGLKPNPQLLANGRRVLLTIWKGGIGTDRMLGLLNEHLDEEKIRASGKDYGLVTLSVKTRRPYELMLDDIPCGQLISYIMASASFPGFRRQTIDDDVFLDGAFYDNCPYKLLLSKGYDEVIAVRTHAPGVFRKSNLSECVSVISPSESLGALMMFTPEQSRAKIELGYKDGAEFCRARKKI